MESEKPVIDFARVRTFNCVIGVGSPAGAQRGRGDHRPDPPPFPADDGTPLPPADINIAGSGAPKTAGGGYVGARPEKCSGRMMAVGTFDVWSGAAVNSDLPCFLYTL